MLGEKKFELLNQLELILSYSKVPYQLDQSNLHYKIGHANIVILAALIIANCFIRRQNPIE
jgi:hypothetical protein